MSQEHNRDQDCFFKIGQTTRYSAPPPCRPPRQPAGDWWIFKKDQIFLSIWIGINWNAIQKSVNIEPFFSRTGREISHRSTFCAFWKSENVLNQDLSNILKSRAFGILLPKLLTIKSWTPNLLVRRSSWTPSPLVQSTVPLLQQSLARSAGREVPNPIPTHPISQTRNGLSCYALHFSQYPRYQHQQIFFLVLYLFIMSRLE